MESDFDIAILTQRPLSGEEQADLNMKIMKALGTDKVDVVLLGEAPILLRFEAINEGRILHSKLSDEALNAYTLSVFREYFHTERFRRLQGEELRKTFT